MNTRYHNPEVYEGVFCRKSMIFIMVVHLPHIVHVIVGRYMPTFGSWLGQVLVPTSKHTRTTEHVVGMGFYD